MPGQNRTISVNGEAEIIVTPNQAVLALGVQTSALDLLPAQQENDAIMDQVLQVTKNFGIPANDVNSEYLSIQPKYQELRNASTEEFIGYFVRRTLLITLTQIEQLRDLLTALLEAGVSHVHSVNFQATDLRRYRDLAREKAIEAAKEKAEMMASVLDQNIGQPISIREGRGPYSYQTRSFEWGFLWSGGLRQNRTSMERELSEVESLVAPSSVSITSTVEISFELQ